MNNVVINPDSEKNSETDTLSSPTPQPNIDPRDRNEWLRGGDIEEELNAWLDQIND